MAGRALWTIVGGFLIGVFARSLFTIGPVSALFCSLLALAVLLLAWLPGSSRALMQGALLVSFALVAMAGGILRMDSSVLTGDMALTAHVGESVTLTGIVMQEPDVREASTRIAVHADTLITKFEKPSVSAGVLVVAPAHVDVEYGDRVLAYGDLRLPEAFDTGAGRQFDYPEYLAAQGIGYQLAFAQVERQFVPEGKESNVGNPLKALAIRAKGAYVRGLGAALPEPEAGLASGITVGDKRSIGSELSLDFQRVSLIHMVVLSGYNITVVINAVAKGLAWAPHILRFGASAFVVVFFVLMSGGAASAVRAGSMALIAAYARASGRTFLAARALGIVAVGMVMYNPLTLTFDPSFQLSALATIGLIAFTPIFSAWFSLIPEKWGLREIAASTVATQLAVLPLLLYQNGLLSVVALPANLLALAPVPFAMFFSFIAAIAGIILGPYAAPLAAPAYLLLAYIIAVGKFFAALPFASVSIPAFSAWWMIAAYAALFAGAMYIHGRQRATGVATSKNAVTSA